MKKIPKKRYRNVIPLLAKFFPWMDTGRVEIYYKGNFVEARSGPRPSVKPSTMKDVLAVERRALVRALEAAEQAGNRKGADYIIKQLQDVIQRQRDLV